MGKTINELIQQFRESIPHVHNGEPSKDYINEVDLYIVAGELLERLDYQIKVSLEVKEWAEREWESIQKELKSRGL